MGGRGSGWGSPLEDLDQIAKIRPAGMAATGKARNIGTMASLHAAPVHETHREGSRKKRGRQHAHLGGCAGVEMADSDSSTMNGGEKASIASVRWFGIRKKKSKMVRWLNSRRASTSRRDTTWRNQAASPQGVTTLFDFMCIPHKKNSFSKLSWTLLF